MQRLLLEAGILALAALACWILYGKWQDERHRRIDAEIQVSNMVKAQEIEHDTHEKELKLAGERAATERGLRRVCHEINLPVAPARPDEVGRADPDHGQLADRLAGEIIACRRNAARLTGLQHFDRARAQ